MKLSKVNRIDRQKSRQKSTLTQLNTRLGSHCKSLPAVLPGSLHLCNFYKEDYHSIQVPTKYKPGDTGAISRNKQGVKKFHGLTRYC